MPTVPQQQPHATPATPATTTFDPETKYRLLLRVHSAEDLPHKSSQGAYCKLYVGDTAMLDGSQKKLTKSASTESNGNADENAANDDEHRHIFRTQTKAATLSPTTQKQETTWDEIFEVSLSDPSTEVLSLRVKSQHRFYCPVIGTFAVYLHHLRVGHQADQWFPLRRGKKEAGKIRLNLLITPEHVAAAGGRGKKKRNGSDLAPDIKVALAANFEADRAIQRLVAKQLKDEEERKLRRQRGEMSDEDEDADVSLAKQMDVVSIAKGKEPVVSSGLGSGRGDARFAVLLPPPPSAQSNNKQAYDGAAGNVKRNENFARLKQLEPISVVKEGRRQGDAMGSGRDSSSARYSLPGLVATSTTTTTNNNNNNSHCKSSPTSPVGSGHQRSSYSGATYQTSTAAGDRMSGADYNRRRNANFARVKELDAEPAHHVGSDRGSGSSRSSLPSTPSNRNQSLNSPAAAGGSARHNALYSIPSFGPADLDRNKRHSAASSTDSDSIASAAEYERRIDRKLRKVRKQTEKLRKIKAQLRKYIPDLTDSDSDVSSSSSSSSGGNNNNPKKTHSQHQQYQQQQQQRYYSETPSATYVARGSTSTSDGRSRGYV
jgi:hypothetical protein